MCGRGGAAIAGKFAIIVRQLQGNKNCKEFTGKYTIQGNAEREMWNNKISGNCWWWQQGSKVGGKHRIVKQLKWDTFFLY